MSGSNSYGKISTSGLTFAYDTGEIFNSYKGEATTNLVTYSEYQFLADGYTEALGGWDTHEGTMLIDVANKVPGFTNRSIKMSCINANVYKFHFGSTLTNGQTYTVSFWAKAQVAGGYQNFMLGEGMWGSGGGYLVIEPGSTTNLTTEFQRFKYTFTHTLPTGTYNFATYLYGNGQVAWLSGFQLENKSQATRYLPCNGAPTTRSSTQGLLDLTGGKTIDIGNVSFLNDSTEGIRFDATDDYITLGADYNFKTSGGWTVESVVYYNSVAGGYNNVTSPANFIGSEDIIYNSWYWSVLDNRLALWNVSPGYWRYGSTTLQPNTWYHVTITCSTDGTRYRFYLNGVPEGGDHVDNLWNASYSGLRVRYIGKGNNGNVRLVNGQIPVTKIYDRVLTGEEIAKNAQHYADRYGITIKDGSTQALAAPSAQYLADIGIKANGVYWINNGTTTKQTYCEFKNGEGWMLVMNIKSDYYGDSYLSWNNYDNWINDGDELGNPQFPYVGSGQYRNRDIFRYYPTTKWMIKVHNNGNEFGDGSWAAWEIISTYSGQTFKQIMNIAGASGGGTQISNTYYAQQGMGTSTYARGLDWCSIARTLGHLRVNHLLDNNGVRILGNVQTLETSNTDVTRGIGQIYDIAGNALTNQAYAQYNTHIGPYVNGTGNFLGNRRQFTDQLFPDNSNYNAARGEGLNVNPSLTYGGTPAMVAYYHYGIFIK